MPRPVTVITGASGGIGSALAATLAPAHRLVLSGLDAGPLAELAQRLQAEGAAEPPSRTPQLAPCRLIRTGSRRVAGQRAHAVRLSSLWSRVHACAAAARRGRAAP